MTIVSAFQTPQRRDDPGIDGLVDAKRGQRIAVCVPARNEAATIDAVVAVVDRLSNQGLVDELVVVDDGSVDDTAPRAHAAGATVVSSTRGPGKGQALTQAVAATNAELLVFLDADVTNMAPRFVSCLVAPLLTDHQIKLVKPTYLRSLDGIPGEGGRVTELLARPLLRRYYPELADLAQPLAGECAIRRDALDGIILADGYGVEIGLLIDIFRRDGLEAIAQIDLGERVHRNRPLHQLRPHADDVLAAVLDRVHPLTKET